MQAWAALSAEDTAYSAVPGKSASDTMAAGKDLTLAAIVQVWCESKCTVHSSSSGLRPCCSDADQLPSICRPATMPGQQSLGPLTCAAISSCRAGEDPCAFEQANMPASPLKLPFQAWRLHCLWLVEFADAPFEAACGPLCLLLSNLVPQKHSVEQSCSAVAHQLRHTHCTENTTPHWSLLVHIRGWLLANAHEMFWACLSAAPCLTTWHLCSATGNEAFCTGIALWAFSQQGVLQAAPLRHHAQGGSEQPALYRINDDIDVEVDIQELRGGRWQPYR